MRANPQALLRPIHPSWCLYASFCGIIIGIVASLSLGVMIIDSWAVFIFGIFVIIMTIRFSNKTTLIIALVMGVFIGNFRVIPHIVSKTNFEQMVGCTVTFRGKIHQDPDRDAGQIKVQLSNLETVDENHIQLAGIIYVTIVEKGVQLERSDLITIEGKLGAGFGTYAASMYRANLKQLERSETGDVFARLKNWFADLVRNFIPSPEVDLGLGYLVGMKSGLPDDLAETLKLVGMTHVVVASGAHLGILVGAAGRFFGKISKFSGLLFSSLLICCFVLIVGFTPSMTRAALVAILGLVAGYFGRKFTPLRLLIFVATITLLLEPTYYINLGWQLSFASFFGIMIVGPTLQAFLYGGKKPPWLASMLLTSLATSLICAPILIYNFGTLSLLSFIANLIILPTLPYVMLLVFLTGTTSFCPVVAQFFSWLATALLDLHIWVVNILAEKTTFIFELPSGFWQIFLIYLPILACIFWLKYRQKRRYII